MSKATETYPKPNGYEASDNGCAPALFVLRCQLWLALTLFCMYPSLQREQGLLDESLQQLHHSDHPPMTV